jgi:hypothetical protein
MTIDYTFRPCLVSTPGTARATIRIIERVPIMQGFWESDPSTATLYEEEVRRLLDRVFRIGIPP